MASTSSHSFCVIIKPDGVRRALVGKIIHRFEKKGFVIKNMKMIEPDEDYAHRLLEHYAEHSTKYYFESFMKFMTSGNAIIMEMLGDISIARTIVGDSVLPIKCAPGSIRYDYASSISENIVHCSENIERGKIEVTIWFDDI